MSRTAFSLKDDRHARAPEDASEEAEMNWVCDRDLFAQAWMRNDFRWPATGKMNLGDWLSCWLVDIHGNPMRDILALVGDLAAGKHEGACARAAAIVDRMATDYAEERAGL